MNITLPIMNIALPPTTLPAASTSSKDGKPSSTSIEDKRRMDFVVDANHQPLSNHAGPSLLSTPTKKNSSASLDEYAASIATTPKSSGSRYNKAPNSSCKRRRLVTSEDDENVGEISPAASTSRFMIRVGGSARKLNYKEMRSSSNNDSDDTSDESDDEEEIDPLDQEANEMRQASVRRKIAVVNCEDEEDHLIDTSGVAKLFELVKDFDVVAMSSGSTAASTKSSARGEKENVAKEGKWVYRGSGCVKFIKNLLEGYDCGMVRMQLAQNGTLTILMCHELTHEEVLPMPAKKGKAYTWITKDWAYSINATRTFAIRFDDDMAAMKWKENVEQSKMNNQRIRRGLDVPETGVVSVNNAEVEDVCSNLEKLSTSTSAH